MALYYLPSTTITCFGQDKNVPPCRRRGNLQPVIAMGAPVVTHPYSLLFDTIEKQPFYLRPPSVPSIHCVDFGRRTQATLIIPSRRTRQSIAVENSFIDISIGVEATTSDKSDLTGMAGTRPHRTRRNQILQLLILLLAMWTVSCQAAPIKHRKSLFPKFQSRSVHKHIMPLVEASTERPTIQRQKRPLPLRRRSVQKPSHGVVIEPQLLPSRKGKRLKSLFEETLSDLEDL
ncbi:hypothetical protein P389DRAFT_16764 [Cystobasidium minutum MCA 4210]|uniref:uncharacterized protein n=1 Tax=Cystobasidium minutum MCA 4210 TaxID=1397322 RepID=UPI0034CD94CD|eukprot:jgi/Rhomi1/16764/CE16763_177